MAIILWYFLLCENDPINMVEQTANDQDPMKQVGNIYFLDDCLYKIPHSYLVRREKYFYHRSSFPGPSTSKTSVLTHPPPVSDQTCRPRFISESSWLRESEAFDKLSLALMSQGLLH